MKKLIAITLILAIIITTYSFKSKASVEGEGSYTVMSMSGAGLIISYGNEKSETIDLQRNAMNPKATLIANGSILVNQLNKLKAQGYELKTAVGDQYNTNYIFEKK